MQISITETGEVKELTLKDCRSDILGKPETKMPAGDYDWWVSQFAMDNEGCESGIIWLAKQYSLALIQAVLDKHYDPYSDELNRTDIVCGYFGDAEHKRFHHIQKVEVLDSERVDSYPSNLASDFAAKHGEQYGSVPETKHTLSFVVTDVLVPKLARDAVVFENIDLQATIKGIMGADGWFKIDSDSLVIISDYYKKSSDHLSFVVQDWITAYFEEIIYTAEDSGLASIQEACGKAVKDACTN